MPIIKDVEIHWAKLDPEHPVPKYLKPTVKEWSMEIRTPHKKVADNWRDEFHLRPKLLQDEETDKTYWRAKLQKIAVFNTKDPAGKMAYPVEVVGPKLEPIDPNTLGNGSIGDVMVTFRTWVFEGKEGITADLSKVRVKKIVEYYRDFELFEELDEELEVLDTIHDTRKPEKVSETVEEDDEIYD